MKNVKVFFVVCFMFYASCFMSFSCASSGLVLKPKEVDVHRGTRNYHFANDIIGLDFYFIKSDEESMMPDQTSVFIDNRTGFPMAVVFFGENKRILAKEVIPPFTQTVLSMKLPYGEWMNMLVAIDKNYTTRIKLELF